MENNEISLHYWQSEILKKLSLEQALNFNKLIQQGLESEHLNYHLKKLMQLNLVEKENDKYKLTDKGKGYVSYLDNEGIIVEKQPKSSVLMNAIRINKEGEIEYLLCKRLKQPYFGKVGKLTGKIKYGETFKEACSRELFEETGLSAKNIEVEEIYHKIRYREDGSVVQDNIFFICFLTDLEGTFINKLPYQENFWITKKEIQLRKDLDLFDSLTLPERTKAKILEMREEKGLAEGY